MRRFARAHWPGSTTVRQRYGTRYGDGTGHRTASYLDAALGRVVRQREAIALLGQRHQLPAHPVPHGPHATPHTQSQTHSRAGRHGHNTQATGRTGTRRARCEQGSWGFARGRRAQPSEAPPAWVGVPARARVCLTRGTHRIWSLMRRSMASGSILRPSRKEPTAERVMGDGENLRQLNALHYYHLWRTCVS